MPCNSPNKVFYIGINPDNGKKKILFASRNTTYVYRKTPHDNWIYAYNADPDSALLFRSRGYQVIEMVTWFHVVNVLVVV